MAGPMRRALAVLAAIVAALAMLAAQPRGAHAALAWTMTASPLAVSTGVATTFTLVATNGDPLTEIGCVVVDVPATFAVAGASVASSTAGDSWTVSRNGNRVQVFTTSGGDRLELLQSVTFRVVATALAPGSLTWPGDAYRQQDCSGTGSLLAVPPVVVVTGPAITPTPVPTPVATPVPIPLPSPSPLPIPAPIPTLLPTPLPTVVPPTSGPTPPPASPSARSPGASAAVRSPAAIPASAAPSDTPAPSTRDGEAPSPSGSSVAASARGSGSDGGSTRAGITSRDAVDAAIEVGALDLLDGMEIWAIPAATLSVPGLLVLLWVAIQAVGSIGLLPAVRRLRGERRS